MQFPAINRCKLHTDYISTHKNTIIVIDIKNFTYYNEIYGQDIGDFIIKKCMQALDAISIEHGCNSYRIAGDLFALMYTNTKITYDNLLNNIKDIFVCIKDMQICGSFINEEIVCDVTLGIAYAQENALTKAEIALKHAKEKRNNFFIYSTSLDKNSNHNQVIYWQKKISESIKKDAVEPFFQPIVDKNKNLVKYEALIRIIDIQESGDQKIISPINFLEISKRTNQYEELSSIMISKTFEKMQHINTSFSINLSLLDIENKCLIKKLKKYIHEYTQIQHSLFKKVNTVYFEIVEDEHIHDYNNLYEFMSDFNTFKVELVIDDFGSGYSSFMHLLKIKPKYLKLDGSLIKNIVTDNDAKALVKGMIRFAHVLGINIIAEYVHNEAVYLELKNIGVDQYQGYYFGQPSAF